MELIKALGDWTASLSASTPRLKVKPPFTLLGTLLAVSAVSFSSNLLTLAVSSALSLIILGERSQLALKVSTFWFAFTSALTLFRPESFPALPARVAASVLTLNACISLGGLLPLIRDLRPLVGEELSRALRVMVFQVSEQLRGLTSSVLAKRSRQLADASITGDYGFLAIAVTDLFIRGPRRAKELELVIKSRMWYNEVWNPSFKDTLAFLTLPALLWGVNLCFNWWTFP